MTVEQEPFSTLYSEKTQEYRAEVELARKKKEHEKETKTGTKTSDISKKEWLNHTYIDWCIFCKSTFIHNNFILQLTLDKLVCDEYFSQPSPFCYYNQLFYNNLIAARYIRAITMMRILWTLQKFLAHKWKLVYSILRENRWIRVPDVNLIHVQYDVRQSNHKLRSLWDVIRPTVSKYTKDLVVDTNTSCSYNWALNYQKKGLKILENVNQYPFMLFIKQSNLKYSIHTIPIFPNLINQLYLVYTLSSPQWKLTPLKQVTSIFSCYLKFNKILFFNIQAQKERMDLWWLITSRWRKDRQHPSQIMVKATNGILGTGVKIRQKMRKTNRNHVLIKSYRLN